MNESLRLTSTDINDWFMDCDNAAGDPKIPHVILNDKLMTDALLGTIPIKNEHSYSLTSDGDSMPDSPSDGTKIEGEFVAQTSCWFVENILGVFGRKTLQVSCKQQQTATGSGCWNFDTSQTNDVNARVRRNASRLSVKQLFIIEATWGSLRLLGGFWGKNLSLNLKLLTNK